MKISLRSNEVRGLSKGTDFPALIRSLQILHAPIMGDAMTGANIFAKDLLVIERLSDYRDGCIILAFVDGQRLVRKLEKREAYLPLRSS